MITSSLQTLFSRDLEKLKLEIESYSSTTKLWQIDGDIKNSAGNLTLHLIGNLNHFVGSVLGNTGFVRQRDNEFSHKNAPRKKLVADIVDTQIMMTKVLNTLSDEDLKAEYPIHVFGEPMTTEYFLLHLTTHLNYHLGQINYHRRLLDSK